ncbi:hypothetical protein BpHYR1_035689 [Brachionus plicatilis]|uniref:Uncharacterized protein n=1 Tax=Brachionus plicatilis TaxID=10195 RepID=A0A3M7QM35_BRAPC|nr:hypothetical protein BpHYR1_035689 [Brachionus plicatilis]
MEERRMCFASKDLVTKYSDDYSSKFSKRPDNKICPQIKIAFILIYNQKKKFQTKNLLDFH